MGFWDKIPPKLLIALALIAFIYAGAAISYALYKNTPVEIFFGFAKFGERDDILRARLVKALADNEARIAPEVYNAALEKAKVAESKSSEPNPELKSRLLAAENEVGKLKFQIKERDTKIAALEKELAEASKDNVEVKRTLEGTRKELQLSRKEFQERGVQLDELKKKQVGSIEPKKQIQAFIQQLASLEQEAPSMSGFNQTALVTSYNNMLKSMKKDLPNDTYIQGASELNPSSSWSYLGPALKLFSAQLKNYLEQTYLK